MTTSRKDPHRVSRRAFLQVAGLGGVAAGAAAAGLAAESTEAAAGQAVQAEGSGYRETEHVRTYYAYARF